MFRSQAIEDHIIESIAFCRPEFQSELNPGDLVRPHDIWYSAPRLYIPRLSVDLFWALWTAPIPAGSGIHWHSGTDRNSTGSHEARQEFFQSHLYLSEIDQHMKRTLVFSERKKWNERLSSEQNQYFSGHGSTSSAGNESIYFLRSSGILLGSISVAL